MWHGVVVGTLDPCAAQIQENPVRTRLLVPTVVVAAALVLGACSSGDHDSMDDMSSSDSGGMAMGSEDPSGAASTLDIPDGADFNATDVAFARGMIPHHGQAVQMADMALDVSTNAEVRALADQIKAAQSPEIEQLTAWLTAWGQDAPDPNAMMEDEMNQSDGMVMSGMMSAADMARLGNSAGTEFDRMFLEMMVVHHEGAIEMAEQELDEGKYQPTKDLAAAVIAGQQAEIGEMNALLAALPA